jgi:hypothetical protein
MNEYKELVESFRKNMLKEGYGRLDAGKTKKVLKLTKEAGRRAPDARASSEEWKAHYNEEEDPEEIALSKLQSEIYEAIKTLSPDAIQTVDKILEKAVEAEWDLQDLLYSFGDATDYLDGEGFQNSEEYKQEVAEATKQPIFELAMSDVEELCMSVARNVERGMSAEEATQTAMADYHESAGSREPESQWADPEDHERGPEFSKPFRDNY